MRSFFSSDHRRPGRRRDLEPDRLEWGAGTGPGAHFFVTMPRRVSSLCDFCSRQAWEGASTSTRRFYENSPPSRHTSCRSLSSPTVLTLGWSAARETTPGVQGRPRRPGRGEQLNGKRAVQVEGAPLSRSSARSSSPSTRSTTTPGRVSTSPSTATPTVRLGPTTSRPPGRRRPSRSTARIRSSTIPCRSPREGPRSDVAGSATRMPA